MDIKFSAEDLAFRDEVREFFASEFDEEISREEFRDGMVLLVSDEKSILFCA